MSTQIQTKQSLPSNDADLGRSQAIFVAVGLAIILGGLWLLYSNTGPYHPDVPVSENVVQGVTDS